MYFKRYAAFINVCVVIIHSTSALKSFDNLKLQVRTYEIVDIKYNDTILKNPHISRHLYHLHFKAFSLDFNMEYILDVPLFFKVTLLDLMDSPLNYKAGKRVIAIKGKFLKTFIDRLHGFFDVQNIYLFNGIIFLDDNIIYVEPIQNYIDTHERKVVVYLESDVLLRTFRIQTLLDRLRRPIISRKTSKPPISVFPVIKKTMCIANYYVDYSFYHRYDENIFLILGNIGIFVRILNRIYMVSESFERGYPGLEFIAPRVVIMTKDNHLNTTSKKINSALEVCKYMQSRYCLTFGLFHDGSRFDYVERIIANGSCPTNENCFSNVKIALLSNYFLNMSLPLSWMIIKMIYTVSYSFDDTYQYGETNIFSSHKGEAFKDNFIPELFTKIMLVEYEDSFKSRLNLISNALKTQGQCIMEKTAICGNLIIEEDEECDCGDLETCAFFDKCCTPMEGIGNNKPCTLRRDLGYVCTPQKDDCCSSDCKILTAENNKTCISGDRVCSSHSQCDGTSSVCVGSLPTKENEICSDGFQICRNGTCRRYICAMKNLPWCICQNFDEVCHICCLDENNKCFSTYNAGWNELDRSLYFKKPFSKCPGLFGECIISGKCLLFEKNWLSKNIYTVTFSMAGIGLFLIFLFSICILKEKIFSAL